MTQNKLLRALAATFLLLTILAAGTQGYAAQADIANAAPANDSMRPHNHEDDIRHIHKYHLNRMLDKLVTEPAVLEQSCKYESDISTAPPVNRVALTFDDGPAPGATEYILDLLKKYNITATFFMVGKQADDNPELVEKVRAGHQLVANHSWDHPNFHEIDAAEQASQVLRNEAVLAKDQSPKLFRYPYGNSSCETNTLVHARGYKIVGWHIDSCDWAYDKSGKIDMKEAMACGVAPQYQSDYVGHVVSAARARKGGIILMHEIHRNTLKQLEAIITRLLAEGFVFGSILDPEFQSSLR